MAKTPKIIPMRKKSKQLAMTVLTPLGLQVRFDYYNLTERSPGSTDYEFVGEEIVGTLSTTNADELSVAINIDPDTTSEECLEPLRAISQQIIIEILQKELGDAVHYYLAASDNDEGVDLE